MVYLNILLCIFVQSLETVFYKLAYESSQGDDAYLDDTKVAIDVCMTFKDDV